MNYKEILQNGIVLKTSGSTGTPKEIYQPPPKIKAANSIAREVQDINSKSRILTVCTLKHAGGLLAQTLPGFEVGAHIDVYEYNPYHWVKNIQKYTHSHLTPKMADAITRTKSFEDLNLTNITIMCGSDVVDLTTVQKFIDKNATFIINWGMTEIGPVAINETFKKGCNTAIEGILLGNNAYCETQIKDGELLVKGEICVFDDWFRTGDLVEQKSSRYFYKGRVKKV